ncbi:restriction endonuclease subunit S [Limosilactobacillus reuteri]|uniref:restriction endonuclease subunit S n=1 Tax=Limosilactobacillus reuteri TaxID=1598 RepID=UPI001E61B4E2|nr:restriction endonuclease subunit S [Limosilactobacillus reuteri]MCC4328124.1 restriction endonuclease subunit S [Limosilactobacillus reuteri]MCC4338165.1 restriction endonuclease subunit S [Limosilactobacillus reuteri]
MDKKPEKLVPEVRFKGFTDDWEHRKFDNVVKRINDKDDNPRLPHIEFENIISGNGTLNKNIKDLNSKKIGTKFQKEDILFGKLRPYLKNWYFAKENGIAVGDFWVLRAKRISVFVYYLIQTEKFYSIANLSSGSKMPRSDWNLVSNSRFNFPENTIESIKIGNLILQLDKLITLQQRKLEQLKQLKKAMLQQLFVDKNSKQPNLRFKNFNSDWKQRKLKNISKRILRKNSDLQSLLPLTISAQDGLVDQTLYFNKQVASKQLKNYLLLYNGDFAYNKSYSVGYPYGAIKRLDKYKQGVLSTLYIAFKPTNINSDFLQHYYDTDKWYREIYRNAAEGARNHGLLNISTNDFFNSKLVTPSDNDEQLKIAKIINLFNHLITLRQNKLTQLTTLKKYLLQNLFI